MRPGNVLTSQGVIAASKIIPTPVTATSKASWYSQTLSTLALSSGSAGS